MEACDEFSDHMVLHEELGVEYFYIESKRKSDKKNKEMESLKKEIGILKEEKVELKNEILHLKNENLQLLEKVANMSKGDHGKKGRKSTKTAIELSSQLVEQEEDPCTMETMSQV